VVSLSIPNDIREFWYNERPDILDYMQKAYKDLDIQFLPDSVVKELNQKILTTDLSSTYDSFMTRATHLNHSIPTELLSTNNLFQTDTFFTNLNDMNEHVQNFVQIYVEKFF
jgi:hypothetical protein